MKVLIAAGGTAGHVMPALRVAEELLQKDDSNKVLFVTTKKKQDIDLIRSRNFKVKSILSGKFRRYFSLLNIIDPFFIFIGVVQSIIIIIKFRPNIIFSKGGYLSLPVVIAGRMLFRKIVVHESDLKMGMANKIAAFFSNKVLVSFPVSNYLNIKANKLVYTGNPIREIFYNNKLENGNTILIMGGSQGAVKINDAVSDVLDKILERFTLIHLTGNGDYNRFKEIKGSLRGDLFARYKVFPTVFGDLEVSHILSEATIIVSRAGAGAICESSFVKKPLILIPLLGHQENNAEFLEKEEAAMVIKNDDLTGKNLLKSINNLMDNKDLQHKLSKNISRFSCPNPQILIVENLELLSSK